MSEKLLLKKYGNRRLYSTEKSVYITLDDVACAIRQGREVEIRDAKTREDVTSFILTQIILEESRRKQYLLPVPLLMLLIRHGENRLRDFFDRYLPHVLNNYLDYRAMADDRFEKWLDCGDGVLKAQDKSIRDMPGFKPFSNILNNVTPPAGNEGK